MIVYYLSEERTYVLFPCETSKRNLFNIVYRFSFKSEIKLLGNFSWGYFI